METTPTPSTPLSVLDLAVVPTGWTSGDALRATTELAQAADRLDFMRFWVAEHHNMAMVASTEPAVLIAHLAANTNRIRVGSGGVMLPNHAPLVVAEQFAMLEALHPDRIDLGVGRAPGTDRRTAQALRRGSDGSEDDQFPSNLLDVMGLLGDVRTETGLFEHFTATPVATSTPAVALLGSSGFSARLAGILGLPFGFAHHFDMGGTAEAAEIYRENFRPSPVLSEPYLIVTAVAVAADTPQEAERLLHPHRLRKYGMRTGRMLQVGTPEEAAAHPEFAAALAQPSNSIHGTDLEVEAGLRALRDRMDAQELMLTIPTADVASRVHSLELVSSVWSHDRQADRAPAS